MYNHHFSNFGWPPVPDDMYKDSAIRHPRFWRRRFLNVCNVYRNDIHLGQWTTTILAIFHSPAQGRLQLKFEQFGTESLEEKSFEILNIFPI